MFAYPGGRLGDPATPGFDPFRNYLCDLITLLAHNGGDNTFGMLCARVGMVATGLGLLPLWLSFPMPSPPRAEALLRRCGWLTTLALPAVAWTPSGDWPRWHSFALLLAGVHAAGFLSSKACNARLNVRPFVGSETDSIRRGALGRLRLGGRD